MGSDGLEVTVAVRGGGQVLRLSRHGTHLADLYSVDELRRFVDLADLCEVITVPFGERAACRRHEAVP
ncbi:hypothetical protein GCM10009677_41700 [Sphaerisporangium rubeum]